MADSHITVSAADWAGAGEVRLPIDPAGVEYFNFFRGGRGVLGRNLIRDKPRAAVNGVPAVNGHYASFSFANFLRLAAVRHTEFTYIAAMRAAAGGVTNHAMATYKGGAGLDRGSSLFLTSGSNKILQAVSVYDDAGIGTGTQSSASGNIAGEWHCAMFSVKSLGSTGSQLLYDFKTGLNDTDAILGPLVEQTMPVLVGSAYTDGAPIDVQSGFFATRALDLAEGEEIYQMIKRAAAIDGIGL